MTETIILESNCPSCGKSFKPDLVHGMLRRCSSCGQWSVATSENVNENVIFKIILFQHTKDELKRNLWKMLVERCTHNVAELLGNVSINSFYLPVREIGDGENRKLIPANKSYEDLFIYSLDCKCYDKIIDISIQKNFSSDIIRNNQVNCLEVNISKNYQDKNYGLYRDDIYKILYLPVYEISFANSSEKWYCLGIHDFWGLDKAVTHLKSMKENEDNDFYIFKYAFGLAGIAVVLRLSSCNRIFIDGERHISALNWLGYTVLWLICSYIIGLLLGKIIKNIKENKREEQIRKILFNA